MLSIQLIFLLRLPSALYGLRLFDDSLLADHCDVGGDEGKVFFGDLDLHFAPPTEKYTVRQNDVYFGRKCQFHDTFAIIILLMFLGTGRYTPLAFVQVATGSLVSHMVTVTRLRSDVLESLSSSGV